MKSCLLLAALFAASPAAAVDFAQDVLPIFSERCYGCHGPEKQTSGYRLDVREIALQGGDYGEAAIVPMDADSSPLLRYVSSEDEDELMPPKDSGVSRLSADQVATLRAWVEEGAVWPDEYAGSAEAAPHWSLQPLVRPAVPAVHSPHSVANPVDAFIDTKLVEHGLMRSPRADAAALVRRLTFDLAGMPPSPEQVDRFVQQSYDPNLADDAYDRLVDPLLASPRYGERWARHWFDVVRFAESDGFETNQPRPNAWHYRDYVIDAFNSDKPYDHFVREQLAGDAFAADAATGFLVGGPWDRVKSPDPVLTAQQRSDELHDMVSTTGSAFLGLTVGCARCHSHKFDPISQTDYYALVACLSGVQHGERPLPIIDPGRAERTERVRKQLAEVTDALDELMPVADPAAQSPRRAMVNPRRNVERIEPAVAKRVRFTVSETNNGIEPCIDEIELWTEDGRNVASTATATSSGDYPGDPQHRLANLNDGHYGNSRSWISNTAGTGWVQLELPQPETLTRIVWARDRLEQFTDRLATGYMIEVSEDGGHWRPVASSSDRAAYSASEVAGDPWELGDLDAGQQEQARGLDAQRRDLETELTALTAAPMAYCGLFQQPSPTHRLSRGDPMQPKEEVAPAALSSVGKQLVMPTDAPEQQRRVMLAGWIADPEHPLTARVIVNRLWQYHFGTGLVGTPSDFGRNGAEPSHPELLDWLACELISHGWSIKHIQRLIVTSEAYKQSSRSNSEAAAIDAGTRWLWRFPPRRLEAESLRDAVLATSGQIDLRMGGPGFDLFEPNTNYVKVYETKRQFGPGDFRRMVYQAKPRAELDTLFGAFDCPDAGQIQPKRNVSITPLQALNLLNSEFMLEQSQRFAQRIEREAGNEPELQIRRGFQLAFARSPTEAETAASRKLIEHHGLTAFCRAVYNANEFIYVY